ncbi:MAG: hypothetical protein GY808_06155 [Gammaproteobacteria bacterium]|nr:hypothetical protein [Gammaproteobacteria bacterium]
MNQSNNLQKDEFHEYFWKALQVFNVYRLFLTTTLIFLQQLSISPKVLGAVHPTLYLWTISLYFLFAIIVILLLIKRIPGYKASVILQISLDIFAVITIIHASGGLNNGLGVLLAVSVGTSSLLIASQRAMIVPSVATIGLFAEATFANIHDLHVLEFTQPAILGASFFIISLLSLQLAKRLHYSERLAIESQASLANMEAISDNIIQTMTIGVLIIDHENRIRLINDAAWKDLGMPASPQYSLIKDVSNELFQGLKHWRKNSEDPDLSSISIHIRPDAPELQIRFKKLGEKEHEFTMVFLEDTSFITQKAKQLKLSSLGRLTASIAHEIRNPLGAISHAAQLLEESETADAIDKNLCNMIHKHSRRVNDIVENVMNLSQRKPPQKEDILLLPFLESFIADLSAHEKNKPDITLNILPPESNILFDKSQLSQVLTNLCNNGLHYSMLETNKPSLSLTGGEEYGSSVQYLDIIDNGPGISQPERDKLFEPFYTTSEHGTGLGLYLARELCEANGARLNFIPIPQNRGCCFRINFVRHRDQD